MSLQQIKAKLLAVSLFTVSACGTLALFGCVPVVARIAANPPFSIGKIEAFLLQQANLPTTPDEPVEPGVVPALSRSESLTHPTQADLAASPKENHASR